MIKGYWKFRSYLLLVTDHTAFNDHNQGSIIAFCIQTTFRFATFSGIYRETVIQILSPLAFDVQGAPPIVTQGLQAFSGICSVFNGQVYVRMN